MSATRNGRTVLQRDHSRTASFQFSENGEHRSDRKQTVNETSQPSELSTSERHNFREYK